MEKFSLESLKKQSLLNGLSDNELTEIAEILETHILSANTLIFEEGDRSTDLYLIVEGEIGIYRKDSKHHFELPLKMLQPGSFFGEMAFLDPSPRAAMAKTIKETTILKLSKADLDKPSMRVIYNKIIENIAKVNIEQLRAENSTQIISLRYSLQKMQARCDWATLVMTLLCLYCLANMLHFVFTPRITSSFATSFYWAIIAIPLFSLVKWQQLDLEIFGITLRNLKKILKETFLIGLGGLMILWLAHRMPFHAYAIRGASSEVILNYLFLCIFREFVSRGVLLTSVLNFFDNQKMHLIVFVIALFLTYSLPINYNQSNSLAAVLLINIILNYFYIRYRNLLTVIFISFLLEILF